MYVYRFQGFWKIVDFEILAVLQTYIDDVAYDDM